MMLLFSSAHQHLLSKSQTSCSSLQSIIFPFTCIPTSWYILMMRYYPVACNSDFFWLSIWWMTTQLVAFDDPCLCWGKECSCLRGLFYKLYYSFPLLCLLSFKYFSTHTKNVYEQATVYGVSVFSEMILWTKETFSFYSNASSSWISRCKVWKLGNIIWGIFLHIPQF